MLEAWDNKQRQQYVNGLRAVHLPPAAAALLDSLSHGKKTTTWKGSVPSHGWSRDNRPQYTHSSIYFYIYCPVATSFRRRRKKGENPNVGQSTRVTSQQLVSLLLSSIVQQQQLIIWKTSLTRRQEETPFERKCRRSRLPTDIHIHMGRI